MDRINQRIATLNLAPPAPSVVQLAHNVPGHYRGREVRVTSRQMDEMLAVQRGIREVEHLTRYGSLNQQADTYRMGGEVSKSYYARESLEDERNIRAYDIRGQATITVEAQAANCGGKNALLMALLSQPGSGVNRPLNYVRSTGGEHYYLAIGDERSERSKDMGFGDAWPTLAGPMMLRDSLMWDDFSKDQIRSTHAPGSAPILSAREVRDIRTLSQAEIDRRVEAKTGSADADVHRQGALLNPTVQQQTHMLQDTGIVYRDRDDPSRVLRQETSATRFSRRYEDPLEGIREKAPLIPYRRR